MGTARYYWLTMIGDLRMLRWSFERYDLYTASNRGEALQLVNERRPACCDLGLGSAASSGRRVGGLATLEEILASWPETQSDVVTATKSGKAAVKRSDWVPMTIIRSLSSQRRWGLVVDEHFHWIE